MSATAAETKEQFLQSVRSTLFVTGALALIFGLIITFQPARTGAFIVALLALYTVAVGVFNLYLAITGGNDKLSAGTRWGYALLGVLYAAAGVWLLILTIQHKGAVTAVAATFLGVMFGVLWIIQGIVTLFEEDKGPWVIIFSILSILAGIALLIAPALGGATLWIFLGVWLIIIGVVQILRGIFWEQTVSTVEKHKAEIAAEAKAATLAGVQALKDAAEQAYAERTVVVEVTESDTEK